MSKVKLSEIGTFKNGLNFSAERVLSGCKMIGVPDFGDNYLAKLDGLKEVDEDIVNTDYLLQDNDILFVRSNGNKNLVGRAMLIEKIKEKVTFSGFCIRFRITNNNVNPLYMLYLFRSPLFRKLFSSTQQTSISNLNQEILGNIEVEMPTIGQQNRIVKIIHGITRKIENNKRINDNLEQQLMLLYDYWFTKFDFPDNDGNPYQTSGGKMVWNDTLKRNIPENWKVQSVISNCLSSIIKPGVEIFNTKTYLATADVKGTSISTGTIVDYDGRESRANMQPSINSVWFAKMKNSIKHLYLNKEMQPIISSSILSTGFCGLQCKEISFEYIASYVSNAYFEIHKDMLAHGATQEAVNNDDLTGVHIIIPEDTVLRAYHETTQAIYAQISKNICENQELVKLRDWLLPMLMNGQATISD